MSGGFALHGRVPVWVDVTETPRPGPTVVALHDLGRPPDHVAMVSAMRPDWSVATVHQRGHGRSTSVRGGVYTLADIAADTVRVLRHLDAPVVLLGFGRSALVAAVAAATEPTRVRALALAPNGADIVCDPDPSASRRRWFEAVEGDDGESGPGLPFADPLYPDDRDQIWSTVPRPVGWVGAPSGDWVSGAPVDIVVEAGGDEIERATALVDALLAG